MDRAILEGDPHSVLEAMAICGYTIGASEGIIYIRAEYPLAVNRLNDAIAKAEARGLLGDNIMGSGFSFKIRLYLGAGAFVCGEETSLMNSVQGGRGEPRLKPPFPANKGLWDNPTNINNVETYANIPVIILKGADWYREIGTEKSPGSKVFALAGKVNRVGLIEVPMGMPLREVVYEIGGGVLNDKKFKAVQTGGPSGGFIPERELDSTVDFESLQALGSIMGSGAFIVVDESDCMVNMAKFFLEFTAEESCGKCTPCRIGNQRLLEILSKICDGEGTEEHLTELEYLGKVICDTALCGLGQSSPNPVLSTLHFFREEYEAHVRDKKCPAGACTNLLSYKIIPDLCNGCTLCARNCPVDCISGKVKEPHVIDQEKCIKCGVCVEKCKRNAIIRG
jgi:NADH:ubiquinone oxidoreductase subunit F (NADH-binding)/NAD-dependent dihydropyrimidine dehydrogenase PreA subunit